MSSPWDNLSRVDRAWHQPCCGGHAACGGHFRCSLCRLTYGWCCGHSGDVNAGCPTDDGCPRCDGCCGGQP